MTNLTSASTTRIILVRHGQSLANAGGAPPDQATNPLTQLGEAQAKAFADQFSLTPTLFVYTPYLRTQQTAEPLLQRFPSVPVEVWPIHEFTYLEPSRHNGTNEEQQKPSIEEYWERQNPAYRTGPGAESFTEFLARVREGIERLAEVAVGGCVVIFTHGFVMQALRLLFLFPHASDAELMANFRRFHFVHFIDNTEAIEFEVSNRQLRMIGQQHLTGFTLQGDPSHV
jgi:probable phosphoglycerate mutase